MKILVALKQVPDTETKIKVAADGRSLDPADVKWITSPYDEYALEEAIRIKEAKGAEVVALTVGGDAGKDVLKNALALGADTAVLLKGLAATLGILQQSPRSYLQAGNTLDEASIAERIAARAAAKLARNFALADQIRQELLAQGVVLQDSPTGTTWMKS